MLQLHYSYRCKQAHRDKHTHTLTALQKLAHTPTHTIYTHSLTQYAAPVIPHSSWIPPPLASPPLSFNSSPPPVHLLFFSFPPPPCSYVPFSPSVPLSSLQTPLEKSTSQELLEPIC
eukprot:GHVQ01007081.1.p3 GENE.GHVQ01007081.1~~GHVQ01007081.1.p3  ORF type:complete len:117 (-),score=36.37 GHVQ01007081.1:215-565(-)